MIGYANIVMSGPDTNSYEDIMQIDKQIVDIMVVH